MFLSHYFPFVSRFKVVTVWKFGTLRRRAVPKEGEVEAEKITKSEASYLLLREMSRRRRGKCNRSFGQMS